MATLVLGNDGVRRDKGTTTGVFAITNATSDYIFDADTATITETNDVLATLIADLIRQGIVRGTVL